MITAIPATPIHTGGVWIVGRNVVHILIKFVRCITRISPSKHTDGIDSDAIAFHLFSGTNCLVCGRIFKSAIPWLTIGKHDHDIIGFISIIIKNALSTFETFISICRSTSSQTFDGIFQRLHIGNGSKRCRSIYISGEAYNGNISRFYICHRFNKTIDSIFHRFKLSLSITCVELSTI